jgi:two-component system, OmpR family, response regulator CpxR
MCASVEMLWRFCGEKFSSEYNRAHVKEKCRHAQPPEFFNGQSFPLASAALYTRALGDYDSSRSGFFIRTNYILSALLLACAASETGMKPKRTILCLDENEQALSIRKVLLETRGYRVIACSTRHQALESFNQGGIDLILAELAMPGLEASKLIEEIKAVSPQTPAILTSTKIKIYDRDMHADAFLPKGMHAPAELLERIRLLLIRKRGPKRSQNLAARSASHSSVA